MRNGSNFALFFLAKRAHPITDKTSSLNKTIASEDYFVMLNLLQPEIFFACDHVMPKFFWGVSEGQDGPTRDAVIWYRVFNHWVEARFYAQILNQRFPNQESFANWELDGRQRTEALIAVLYCHRIGEVAHGAVPALPHGDAEAEGHQAPGHKYCRIPASGPLHFYFRKLKIYTVELHNSLSSS